MGPSCEHTNYRNSRCWEPTSAPVCTGRWDALPGAGGQGPDVVEEEESVQVPSARSDQPTPPTKSCMKIYKEQQQVMISCTSIN